LPDSTRIMCFTLSNMFASIMKIDLKNRKD
jgi:hypothetical protein